MLTVKSFIKKAREDGGWINTGLWYWNRVFNYPNKNDSCVLSVIHDKYGKDGQLSAYKYTGFGNAWILNDKV